MPCYTPPHAYCNHGLEKIDELICKLKSNLETFESHRKNDRENCQELKPYTDKITDMLCRLLSHENYGVIETRLPDDIQEWWTKHKEWDTKRKDKK